MVNVIFAAAAMLGMLLGGPVMDRAEQPQTEATWFECPDIYDPVICAHDVIYPNLCVAMQHHAKNCVPYLPEI